LIIESEPGLGLVLKVGTVGGGFEDVTPDVASGCVLIVSSSFCTDDGVVVEPSSDTTSGSVFKVSLCREDIPKKTFWSDLWLRLRCVIL
jgi:hypothetical protein